MLFIKIKADSVAWKDQSAHSQNRGNPQMVPHYSELLGIIRNFYQKPEFAYTIKEFGYIKSPNYIKSKARTVHMGGKNLYAGNTTSNCMANGMRSKEGDCVEFYVLVEIIPLSLYMNKGDTKESSPQSIINKHTAILKRYIKSRSEIHRAYCGNVMCDISDISVVDTKPTVTDTEALGCNQEQDVLMAVTQGEYLWDTVEMINGSCRYNVRDLKARAPQLFDYDENKSKVMGYRR